MVSDTEYYAHTPPRCKLEPWHRLTDHLRGVAEMAAEFGAAFSAGDVCRALGLAHDAGKADPRFQAYLRACHNDEAATSVPHAVPGAAAAESALGPFALAVMGHHAGLTDRADARTMLDRADRRSVEAATPWTDCISRPAIPSWSKEPAALELFVRMCFSALIDADYLDTEAHMAPERSRERRAGRPLAWYRKTLDTHLDALGAASPDTPVNRVRADVLKSCHAMASEPQGAFRLTVPTGGGKTLSGLAFALRHADAYDLRRIVVAIPYTSIIDQTATVFSGVFGPENILEHHSAYDPGGEGEDQAPIELRRKLASENWNSPLIVTTTVQLFDSLFSNRPRACRKLHRIARSVIVLDEAQTLPPELLGPILDVLSELISHYGCSVVFCTATQPDYSGIADTLLTEARQIVPDPARLFSALARVRYHREETPLNVADVAARIDGSRQTLCILNTRRDAVRVVRACRKDEDLFHLSTLMCPSHRRTVLTEVRERLADGRPVRLVATQVVEAGVDLDFPFVLRAVGPLDRIVQAAGRCNREGKLESLGDCLVFELKEAGLPRGWYTTATSLAATAVREDIDSIDQPGPIGAYFRELFNKTNIDAQDIRKCRQELAYAHVAKRFQMIPQGSVALIVRAYDDFAPNKLLAIPPEARDNGWYRAIARCSVGVPLGEAMRMEREGMVATEKGGMKVYEGIYDPLIGIGVGDLPDPADLLI